MANDYKPSWTGGQWEQENPQYPAPPPVVLPKRHQPLRNQINNPEKLSVKAKVGFAGLLTLIFSVVCLAVILGIRNYQLSDKGNFPAIFGGGNTVIEIDPMESFAIAPTIRQASWDKDTELELNTTADEILSPQDIYQQNLPTIVFIEAKSNSKTSTGTGVIMSKDGYIITNAHVIDNASSATVTLWNNDAYDAKLVGYDFPQDLAVLKIQAEDLTPAVFGDSDLLSAGDPSYALGNPLGSKYRSTFTDGMISAVDRVLEVDGNDLVLVQTTAAINSGNSGGALLNQYGEVVGITTIKIMSEQDTIEGMGFAIPSVRVKQVVDRLISGDSLEEGTIGITVQEVTDPVSGLQIISWNYTNTLAEESGMQKGDIIIEANDKIIKTVADLNLLKCYLLVGDNIDYVVYRDGERLTISAPLEAFDS